MSNASTKGITIGIDATNLRDGGGITHLVEILSHVVPSQHSIIRIVVWGSKHTLGKLPTTPWIKKISPHALNKGLVSRAIWQRFELTNASRRELCDILFVPGGSFSGKFTPVIVMSRNLLPFEWRELIRYGLSLTTIRLLSLRYVQSRTFKFSDGVIFLTEYANHTVHKVTGSLSGKTANIPHGVSACFRRPVKEQYSIECYNQTKPFRLLYVSAIAQYKHQWHLISAIHTLRVKGVPLVLDLVGPFESRALRRLNAAMELVDSNNLWINYHGAIPYEILDTFYSRADLGIFASSCENMPNILLETMAAGLPIACSSHGPMPEILSDAGLYFDPENPEEIAQTLGKYIDSPELRRDKAIASVERCKQYSWERCAYETFNFLLQFANNN